MKNTNKYDEIAFLSHKILDLNKKLAESEKAKTRFLSLVTGELNDPVSMLLGLIPQLKPLDKNGDSLHSETLKLHSHIQNIIAASAIESGVLTLLCEPFDPEEVMTEALFDLRYVIKDRNITVAFHDGFASPVIADTPKISLILKNLLANACIHGKAESTVDVSIEQSCGMIIISITNRVEGGEMPREPEIFSRFSSGPGGHGLGIGLSVVRELCEYMNGDIEYVRREWSVTFTARVPYESTPPDPERFNDAVEF